MTPGKLIAIYGVNNLGKTTQANLLAKKMKSVGHKAEIIKDPVYNLEPTGPLMDGYLRGGNPYNLSAREYQLLGVANFYHYKPILAGKLAQGINVISEGYGGTNIAWGVANGIDKNFMVKLLSALIKEDRAFLLDGERFAAASEPGHPHEGDAELINRSRKEHQLLAKELDWITINANQSIEEIHKLIWEEVKKII